MISSIVHSLNQVRKNVLKQANSLQSVVDDFRNYLTPSQTAKLLLVLEKVSEIRVDKISIFYYRKRIERNLVQRNYGIRCLQRKKIK